MSDNLDVIITGRADGVTQAFKAVSDGARQMGVTTEQAAQKSGRSLQDMKKATDDLKVGAAALGVAFTMASRSNIDQQRSIDALMRSYGTAGAEIVKFTNAIEDQSNFSDEAARAAASYGATLVNQYGLSVGQVEQLLTRAADLAERTGLSFEDAAQRVTSAIRGEAESAEVFGIAAGDHALHLDQMAASTTDAERAQIRFAAVMEQSASAAGTAQRASEGTRGAVIDLSQSAGDAAQAFAAWTGPLGEAAAGLSDYALQAGIAIGGVVKLGQGIKELVGVQRLAAAESAALNLAMGPAGLVAAGGLAVGAFALLIASQRDADETSQAVTRAIADLNLELGNLSNSAAGASIGLRQELAASFEAVLTMAGEASDKLAEEKAALDGIAYDMPEFREQSINNFIEPLERAAISTENVSKATLAMSAILNYSGENWKTVAQATADATYEWETGRMSGEHYVDTLVLIASNLGTLFQPINQVVKSVPGLKELESVIGDLSAVKLSPEVLGDIETIKTLGSGDAKSALQSYFDQFKRTGDMEAFAAQVDSVSDRVETLAASEAKLAAIHNTVGDTASSAASGVGDLGHAFEITDEQIAAATQATLEHAEANNRWGPQIAAATEAQRLQREELDQTVASIHQYADALTGTASFASQLRPVDLTPKGGDKATGSAAQLQQVSSALESVLGTFNQLDSLGQASEKAGSIAENLVGNPGEIALIDRLLNQGRISQTAYNDAVKAGYQIQKEQGAVENDLNLIRAKQLPLLADADRQYGNLIDKISKMDAETQQSTLGFMDANEALKAQNALSLVAAASMGDLGEQGRKATQDILQGAVDADPVLREMLESIGLITTDPKTGTIKINFENGKEVQATLDDVVSSIDQLAIAIDLLDGKADLDITIKMQADDAKKKAEDTKKAVDDIPATHNTDITESGGAETESTGYRVTGAINGIPGYHNTTITADASGVDSVVSYVRSLLDGLNGHTATTYIQTISTGSGGQAIGPGGMLGGVMGYANGGMITARLGEAGYEYLHYANGGVGLAPQDGFYNIPRGTLVTPHPESQAKMAQLGSGGGFTFINNGPINGFAGLDEFWDAAVQSARAHGLGG